MTPAIEAARTALESQLSPIATELEALDTKAAVLREQETQLKAALKALEAPSKAAAKPKRKPTGKAAKKQEVVSACRQLLARQHAMPANELEKRVGEALKSSGRTLAGYALRFKEAMQSGEFTKTEDGMVVLADMSSPEQAQASNTAPVQVAAK
ncbi:MAG: hypothetical protein ABJZ55_15050 [Fuerstiella sp.]